MHRAIFFCLFGMHISAIAADRLAGLPTDYTCMLAKHIEEILQDFSYDELLLASKNGHCQASHAMRHKILIGIGEFKGKTKQERIQALLDFWLEIKNTVPDEIGAMNERYVASGFIEIVMWEYYYADPYENSPRATTSEVDFALDAMIKIGLENEWSEFYTNKLKTTYALYSKIHKKK